MVALSRLTLRQSIILASSVFGCVLVITVFRTYPLTSLRIIKLSQWSALVSVVYLYLTLIISPLWDLWPNLPYKEKAVQARRALGVVGWGFGMLHGLVAFFGQLSGFLGLGFLSDAYIVAILYGAIALLIFTLMTLTSSEMAVSYFGFLKWKLLHRFTYIASMLVVIHTLMLGTHFNELSQTIPSVFLFFLLLLISLELSRLARYLLHPHTQSNTTSACIMSLCLLFSLFGTLSLQSAQNTLSVHPAHTTSHDEHTAVASEYSLSLVIPHLFVANESQLIHIEILNNDTKAPIHALIPTHERLLHFVVVDSELAWFIHQDPSYANYDFTTTLTFPHTGRYYAYATFQEDGNTETTLSTQIDVLSSSLPTPSPTPLPAYEVVISPRAHILAADFSTGKTPLVFTIRDPITGRPVTKIDPYMSALGYLVMIREGTYEIYHLQTAIEEQGYKAQPADDRTIPFVLDPTARNITPGKYRLFAEFSVGGTVYTSTFYLTVE